MDIKFFAFFSATDTVRLTNLLKRMTFLFHRLCLCTKNRAHHVSFLRCWFAVLMPLQCHLCLSSCFLDLKFIIEFSSSLRLNTTDYTEEACETLKLLTGSKKFCLLRLQEKMPSL